MMTQQNITMAIKGLGAAGKARYQAAGEMEGIELVGIISRRPEVSTLSWEEALAHPKIETIAISTENSDHAQSIREALSSGKHVLCDFPLALSGTQGRELFALAKEKNRILHIEHIGLLTQEHLDLKSQVETLGKLKRGDYLFQGGWNQKIADPKRTGPYPILAVSRLLQVADWFGPFEVSAQEYKYSENGFSLHLHLKFNSGAILGFTEDRLAGLPRRRSLIAECSQGSIDWRPQGSGGGLFAKDLAWFLDRIQKGRPCYYDEEIMLGVLDQIEKVIKACSE